MFGLELHHRDATRFRRLMHRAQEKRQTGFTFDFSETKFAAPVAMAQLVVQAEACRRAGMHFDVIEPLNRETRSIFRAANWAHHLSPVNYEPNRKFPKDWLPVVRYATDTDLRRLVDATCSVLLRRARIRRQALHGLEWAPNEMADNVFQHAESAHGGLAAVTVAAQRRRVQFVVADAGRGIPATMRTGHSGLGSDLTAVKYALRQGITRSRKIGAGNGLAGTLRIALAAEGSFMVHSARALVRVSAEEPTPDEQQFRAVDRLDGTVVYFEMGIDREFDLEEALLQDGIGIGHWDYLDAAYNPDEQHIRLRVTDEVTSTATRVAAKPLRRLSRNLVFAHPTSKVIIDFGGISSITASFADEVVGKLLVSLGPGRFRGRVLLDGLDEPLVRGQVQRALSQRAAEAEAAEAARLSKKPRRRA